jgi:hypothetical protein
MKISNRTGKRGQCIHCARKIVEVAAAPDEYVDAYGDEGEAWVDIIEGRALCLIYNYSTEHVTAKEWSAGQ